MNFTAVWTTSAGYFQREENNVGATAADNRVMVASEQDTCARPHGRKPTELITTLHLCLTISLKAFSMAPITRLSCWTLFSVKKRGGGGVLHGEPGVPAALRNEAARVRAR